VTPLSGPDPNTDSGGLLGHVRRALEHAVGAARCYALLLVGDVERRVDRAVRRLVLAVALLCVGLVGAVLLLAGVARLLDDCLGPGLGHIVIGGCIVAIAAAVALATRLRGRK